MSDYVGKTLNINSQVRLDNPMFKSSLGDHGDVYIHSKGTIWVLREGQFKLQGKQTKEIKRYNLKIAHHLLTA